MSCPVKYRHLGDFPDYYAGTRTAPYLTLFVGGNHEASSHLWELFYGGWVAPNIYYMGAANVLRFGPLRIAGMSGIWKGFDYRKPHHERLPFSDDDVKSFYHVREVDVRKLLLLRTQVDIGISHDWPRYIENHGNAAWLFRKKPDFQQESQNGQLGSVAAEYVMDRLRPPYWFSAHMHIKFAALKAYQDEPPAAQETQHVDAAKGKPAAPKPEKESNPDEIDLDSDGDVADDDQPEAAAEVAAVSEPTETNEISQELRAQLPASFAKPQPRNNNPPGQPVPAGITNKEVRFLALDKCLPGRHFLQLCEIQPCDLAGLAKYPPKESSPRYQLQYDAEWLAITRVFHSNLSFGDRTLQSSPNLGEELYLPLIDDELAWVEDNIASKGKLDVPCNFQVTAPAHVPGTPEIVSEQPLEYTNPQTMAFCNLLGLENPWDATAEERQARRDQGPPPSEHRGHRGGFGGGRGGRGGGRGRGRGGGGGGRGRGRGRGSGHRGRW
jgi:lariat debranching enzyme